MQYNPTLKKLKNFPVTRYIQENGIMLIILAVMVAIVTALQPRFIMIDNVFKVLRTISVRGIAAFGMTFVIITGGIDLSVGSIAALSGVVAATLMTNNGVSIVPAMFLGLLIGIICGLGCGALAANTSTPPFIVTMAADSIFRGIAYVISKGVTIKCSDEFGILGNGRMFGSFPSAVFIMILVMLFMAILLSKTRFGRNVYAVGGNREAARFAGVNIRRVVWVVYGISGLCASLAGILQASRLYSGQPSVCDSLATDAIAGVVIGGASMSGGIGKIGGTIIGCLITGVLECGLNILNVEWYYQYVMQGGIILLAVLIDLRRRS